MQRTRLARRLSNMKRFFDVPVLAAVGISIGMALSLVHAHERQDLEAGELAGMCKVVYVDGQEDHCIIVVPGTDLPVAMPQAGQ